MANTVLDPFLDGKSSADFRLVYALVWHGVAIFYPLPSDALSTFKYVIWMNWRLKSIEDDSSHQKRCSCSFGVAKCSSRGNPGCCVSVACCLTFHALSLFTKVVGSCCTECHSS